MKKKEEEEDENGKDNEDKSEERDRRRGGGGRGDETRVKKDMDGNKTEKNVQKKKLYRKKK